MTFINKVVIVTGAGSGIGEATAIHFAKLSARLSLMDINVENLNKVGDQCENLSKAKVFKVVVDITNDEYLKTAVDSIIKEYGKIDVVINCAGISCQTGILDADIMSVYDKVIDVNLRATVALAHYTAKALIESKGCIINIASMMACMVSGRSLPYNVSKAGVVHFTKSVAFELAAKGVRVNCISPGHVKTNILLNSGWSQDENEKFWERIVKTIPLQRCIRPEDIAEMAAFLACDKAKSITGANFAIDSGSILSGIQGVPQNS